MRYTNKLRSLEAAIAPVFPCVQNLSIKNDDFADTYGLKDVVELQFREAATKEDKTKANTYLHELRELMNEHDNAFIAKVKELDSKYAVERS